MTANELDLAAAVEDGALQLEAMLAHLMREATTDEVIRGNQSPSICSSRPCSRTAFRTMAEFFRMRSIV